MAKFDRYMLSQLLLFFGFFGLVLVAVFWINRGVRLFDRLIGDGQSALVFLEFTVLGLPGLILLVLPLAAFAATVYTTNRLSNESELTVMLAIGSSPWRMVRPVVTFGLLVGLMMAVLAHILVPAALDELFRREARVSQDVTARLLTEGDFLHPSDGVTFYTREIGADGILRDVFLSDYRNADARMIYTAAEAYLVRDDGQTSLIMIEGLAQRLETATQTLATAVFDDFSYDISALISQDDAGERQFRTMRTGELVQHWRTTAPTGRQAGTIAEEFHSRFAQPLFGAVAAVIGFSVLISAGFSRFGAWREILIAFGSLLLLDGLRAGVTDPIREDAALWPLAYLPALTGALLAAGLLTYASKPFRSRGAVTP